MKEPLLFLTKHVSHFYYVDSNFATLTSVEGDMMGYGGDSYTSTPLKVMFGGRYVGNDGDTLLDP
jgi:hypothetical protein